VNRIGAVMTLCSSRRAIGLYRKTSETKRPTTIMDSGS
jgi:hypothetical protein